MKRSRETQYYALARVTGLALVLLCVFFQRRGLLDWTELVFLGLCIGLQETFLRLPSLRRFRTPMLVAYSMAPLALVVYHGAAIRSYGGDFVKAVLNTPLPMVLVSVQIMVLYVRDAPRLVSVVLVLALFSTVIGVRRPVGDAVWPWLAGIAALSALFLVLQHPGMLFHGVYTRRLTHLPPAARPGGVLRRSFVASLPFFASATVFTMLFLYFAAPRLDLRAEPAPPKGLSELPDRDPQGNGIPKQRDPRKTPNDPNKPPPSVSGLPDGVDLGDFGQIQKGNTPALQVRALFDPEGGPSPLYLRAFTYARFDGERWSPLTATPGTVVEVPGGATRALPSAPGQPTLPARTRQFEVRILQAGLGKGGVVPLPVEAARVREYGGALQYNRVDHSLRGPSLRAGDRMVVEAQQLVATPQQLSRELRLSTPSPLEGFPEYSSIDPALRLEIRKRFRWYNQLGERVTAQNRNAPADERGLYAACQWIVRLFAGATIGDKPAWTYSLDFRPLAGKDSIARFLDTDPRGGERFGHCEYFASAMCALLRCFGVPCRMAAGFSVSEHDLDNTWHATTANAHAWVEVYFQGHGWIAFDPTPAAQAAGGGGDDGGTGPDPENPTPDQPEPEPEPEPEPDKGGTDWINDFDAEKQRRMVTDAIDKSGEAAAAIDTALLEAMEWMPSFLPRSGFFRAALLLAPALLPLLWMVVRRRRRRKLEKEVMQGMGGEGKRRERGLYFQLLLLLARYGFHKRPSETPREFAARVLRRGGDAHQRVMPLTEMYYAMRFGADRDRATDFKRGLHDYAESLKAAMQAAARGGSGGGTEATP